MHSVTQTYFDHAASSPMRPKARDAWAAHAHLLNPAGQYALGRQARGVLDDARERIAAALGCEPIEVIFCASGTEADNIAVQGLYAASELNRIISTPIEHPAVRDTVAALTAQGAQVEMLPVLGDGAVVADESLDTPAAVATCMWANNETGAVQPVEAVIAKAQASNTPVHVDAVQVVGHRAVDFHALGATTLAASAHKFGGPRGVGILLARRSPAPKPILFGGGQERGIRSGTVDVAGAIAAAVALEDALAETHTEEQRLRALQQQILQAVTAGIDDVVVHTPPNSLAGHVHMSFPGAEGDSLIMLLDHLGFAASTGSACANGVNRASHVLLAMGVSEPVARGAVRITLGHTTTQEDVDALLQALPDVVARARLAGMA